MRLCIDGEGRMDPSRALALRGLGFPEVFEMHLAQDAMDELAEIARTTKSKGKV